MQMMPKCMDYGPAFDQASTSVIQSDLDGAMEWLQLWLLPFNLNKCKTLHLGGGNIRTSYHTGNAEFREVIEEIDIRTIMDRDLSFHKHVAVQVNKANQNAWANQTILCESG